ncbi:MAG TPA: nucleotide exchange factor GrpE [Rhodoblastus sp.]|nr:nucleotide exchange factor GrpE [Rhodoblastus sp.]
MTGKTNPDDEACGGATHSGQSAAPDRTQAPGGEAGADADERLRKENADLKDRLLRALAEVENTRRRAERDLSDARRYAITQFASDMLPAADNLERAIASIPAQAREGDKAVRTLIQGVELTERELLRSLEKHGVEKLDPMGARFDPNFHEAMFETPDASVPSGTVTTVVQPGYAIGSRALRPAKVGVSRGGPRIGVAPPLDEPGHPPKNGAGR